MYQVIGSLYIVQTNINHIYMAIEVISCNFCNRFFCVTKNNNHHNNYVGEQDWIGHLRRHNKGFTYDNLKRVLQ
jgi:hypothetical protein